MTRLTTTWVPGRGGRHLEPPRPETGRRGVRGSSGDSALSSPCRPALLTRKVAWAGELLVEFDHEGHPVSGTTTQSGATPNHSQLTDGPNKVGSGGEEEKTRSFPEAALCFQRKWETSNCAASIRGGKQMCLGCDGPQRCCDLWRLALHRGAARCITEGRECRAELPSFPKSTTRLPTRTETYSPGFPGRLPERPPTASRI